MCDSLIEFGELEIGYPKARKKFDFSEKGKKYFNNFHQKFQFKSLTVRLLHETIRKQFLIKKKSVPFDFPSYVVRNFDFASITDFRVGERSTCQTGVWQYPRNRNFALQIHHLKIIISVQRHSGYNFTERHPKVRLISGQILMILRLFRCTFKPN